MNAVPKTLSITIGELSRLTGVGISTLRSWGDRYGLLNPVRSEGGFRLYSRDDVERVLALKKALFVDRTPPALLDVASVEPAESQQLPRRKDGGEDGAPLTPPTTEFSAPSHIPRDQASEDAVMERLRRQLRALQQMAMVLTHSLEINQVVEQALTLACNLFDADASGLLLSETGSSADDFPFAKYSIGMIPSQINELDRTIVGRVMQTRAVVAIPGFDVSAACGTHVEHGSRSYLAMPLLYSDQLRGVAYVAWTNPHSFPMDNMPLAATFAYLVACALENAVLLRKAGDAHLSSQLLLDSDDRFILMTDAEGKVIRTGPRAALVLGYEGSELHQRTLNGILASTSRNRGLGHTVDPMASKATSREVDLQRKDGSLVTVEVRELTAPDCGHNGSVRYVVHDVSETRRLMADVAKRDEHLSVLNMLASALSESLDLDEVLQVAVNSVVRIAGTEIAIISLLAEESGNLVVRAHCNAPEALVEEVKHLKLGEGISGRVAVTGETVVVPADDPRSLAVVPFAKRYKNRSFACVPLRVKDKVIGTMMITSKRNYSMSEEELRLFTWIGCLTGSAVERARTHERSLMSYYDRLVLMRDQLRLTTRVRTQERQQIATELRHYVLERDLESGASMYEPNRVVSALQSLERELRTPLEGISLPSLLNEAVRWRGSYGPVKRTLRVECESWPENVPQEITLQLYTLVVRLLSKTWEASPHTTFVISLVQDSGSISIQLKGHPGWSQSDRSAQNRLDWERLDVSDVHRIADSLGGTVTLESSRSALTLSVRIPRHWDQVVRRKPITALIIDDQPISAQALARLLDTQESVQVVSVVGGLQEALLLTKRLSPDIVVVDVSLPAMKGIDVTRAVRSAFPEQRILILTPDQGQSVVEGLLAGATSFVQKTRSPSDLYRAMNSLFQAEPAVTPDLAERALALMAPATGSRSRGGTAHRLTPREIDILRLIAGGKTSKECCRILRINDKTLRRHVSNMYQKLQIFDRTQLVLYAARKGLIDIGGDAWGTGDPSLGSET